MILQATGSQKKAGVTILTSDKTDLRPKKLTEDRDGHYILTIKGIIHLENIFINIYAPNNRAPKYIKHITELKGESDSITVREGDGNNPQ